MNIRHRYGRAYLQSDTQRSSCLELRLTRETYTASLTHKWVEHFEKGVALMLATGGALLAALATPRPGPDSPGSMR